MCPTIPAEALALVLAGAAVLTPPQRMCENRFAYYPRAVSQKADPCDVSERVELHPKISVAKRTTRLFLFRAVAALLTRKGRSVLRGVERRMQLDTPTLQHDHLPPLSASLFEAGHCKARGQNATMIGRGLKPKLLKRDIFRTVVERHCLLFCVELNNYIHSRRGTFKALWVVTYD